MTRPARRMLPAPDRLRRAGPSSGRRRAVTAGALLVALGVVPLTACGSSGGTLVAVTLPPSSSPSAGESDPESQNATEKSKQADTENSSENVAFCDDTNTRTTAEKVRKPINHMLITVLNTGTEPCTLYGYPILNFGEAQPTSRVNPDSEMDQTLVLNPDDVGYSGVTLSSAEGERGDTSRDLVVRFRGPKADVFPGKDAELRLPAPGVYTDDTLTVTYWSIDSNFVLIW
jgi:hypothetical protein